MGGGTIMGTGGGGTSTRSWAPGLYSSAGGGEQAHFHGWLSFHLCSDHRLSC